MLERSAVELPHQVVRHDHIEVAMPDGCVLAARLWLPEGAEAQPVPAILEYLPYRKNDLTAERDATMQPYLAGHGYAVIRLDLRGAGDSEGVMRDEYLPQELQDGYDAIDWIARQPWCDGHVGMIGISWGGFNGLQIAAMQPPALKTIITLCSTDDRYADDVHYMGGCLLGEQLSWSSIMFGRNTLPPDPANVGDRWQAMWRERLEGSGLWLQNWLEHQTRDDFWKHGSVCEDWSKITIPVYAVSGWADGYFRPVFRLMENLRGPKKGMVGPWAHRYPHIGIPGPDMDFLAEEVRWWDHWLRGVDTGIMDEPMLRLYVQEGRPPAGHYADRPGRWVAEPSWPSPNVSARSLRFGADRSLSTAAEPAGAVFVHGSPLDVGTASGKWCGYGVAGDMPTDQRRDDAGSLCFETEPLTEALDLVGEPVAHLCVAADKPVAQLAVRLVDVHPDGRATRISLGVLNLTHRKSHEHPEPLVPGEFYHVRIPLRHLGVKVAAGHRLRVAISTSYFPMIWPAPEPVTMQLRADESRFDLPVRSASILDETLMDYPPAVQMSPLEVEVIEPGGQRWDIVEHAATGVVELQIEEGRGVGRHVESDLTIHYKGLERYGVDPNDIGSAYGTMRWETGLSRGDWRVFSITETEFTADKTHFIIKARQRVWHSDDLVDERCWDRRIARHLV